MAKKEHARLIRKNVNEWNVRRREHPDLRLDLESANLHGLTLRGAHLAHTNLDWADLSGTDLTGATLADAKLYGAHLEHATLNKADFAEARLVLRETNLAGRPWSDAMSTEPVIARELSGSTSEDYQVEALLEAKGK